jgi:hypothetical protein
MLMYSFAGFFQKSLTMCMTKLRVLVLCFPYFTHNSTSEVPFQVRHKLHYFHFCQNFQKKNYIDYQKFNQGNQIQIQRNNEAFHQSNQKHSKKLTKILTILLNLLLIY